ncbi:non-LTR retroelement reverse transcriptase-like protein [Trifolium pratense]|uniref:Non-LTR retroelement reverse transcriptase-like protein n=1 Tax=Trifolium pratense TaxID=57577 RepID=A0A2K3PA51_TRIPR|nr:hypothetical protein L195_g002574 [Trifolium pratense]PNY12162.1 non-LTR retroelement reverse transcriptase-like protein [Trifolium pratense]
MYLELLPRETLSKSTWTEAPSTINPGRSDFGGIMRNNMGNWLLRFSGFLGIATSSQVELHAIYNGLCLAMDQGFK